jgi:hypothetical protein
MFDVRSGRTAARDRAQSGQTLVEFALVIPIFIVLFMGVIEVALAMNAVVGVNRASQQAAHTASIMGAQQAADCLILRDIEADIIAPNDRTKVREVRIQRTAMAGNQIYATQLYTRGGSLDCTLPDGTTITLPYGLSAGGYPATDRCSVLAGCPGRSTVDNVGVEIVYRHLWATPLNAMFGAFGGGDVGWTITQRNIFRMEPSL